MNYKVLLLIFLLTTTKILIAQSFPISAEKLFLENSSQSWLKKIITDSPLTYEDKDEYNENQDVLRFTTTPKISETVQEHLEYVVQKTTDTSGKISMSWEKVSVEFPFKVK